MRRADRLFRLAQSLRPDRFITARALADELGVSERTIYRDIQDLSLSVPIIGEAGSGYRLGDGFRLPALMFERDELAALLLGMRMVQTWSDRALATAATRALEKIDAVLPSRLRSELSRRELLVPDFHLAPEQREYLERLRQAITGRRIIEIAYRREDGAASVRRLWPLGLFYWGRTWTLAAWCELRDGFRHFRVDRIERLSETGSEYPAQPGRTLEDWLHAAGASS